MKIGLDYHGVIDAYPEFFAAFTQAMCKAKHEIHIITGNEDTQEFRDKLSDMGIHYDMLFSIASYHKEQGVKMWRDDRGTPWMAADIWNKTKAHYCAQNDIDFHMDDTAKYGEYFISPFALFRKVK